MSEKTKKIREISTKANLAGHKQISENNSLPELLDPGAAWPESLPPDLDLKQGDMRNDHD